MKGMIKKWFLVGLIAFAACIAPCAAPCKAEAEELPTSLARTIIPTLVQEREGSLTEAMELLYRGETYKSTLYFNRTYTGKTRHYTGKNISISMDAECPTSGASCDDYFSVELHRAHGLWNDYVGSAGFKRNGFTEATWSNAGAGDYYFVFVKCDDGKFVSSNNVRMFSN